MISYSYQKTVRPERLLTEISSQNLSPNRVETVGNMAYVWFQFALSAEDKIILDSIVNAHQPVNTAELIDSKIRAATEFGEELLRAFTNENVSMGITQAGKTRVVSDACHKLAHYITTGSLYAALEEVDAMIAAGINPSLSPFVTEARLLSYKAKILAFLGL